MHIFLPKFVCMQLPSVGFSLRTETLYEVYAPLSLEELSCGNQGEMVQPPLPVPKSLYFQLAGLRPLCCLEFCDASEFHIMVRNTMHTQ